ncbi:hypothetical protein [Photobacterium damselae]
MKINNLYEFIDNYSGIALLMDENSIVVYHNNNIFNFAFRNKKIIGSNLSDIFLDYSRKLGPITYIQALNFQEKNRLCWLNQEIMFNTEYYDNILFTIIRMIINIDKEHLLLLIDKANLSTN